MSSPAPSSPTWWSRCWANRKRIAAGIGAALMVACPLLPPEAQGPCRKAHQLWTLLGQLDAVTATPSPPAPAACSENCGD